MQVEVINRRAAPIILPSGVRLQPGINVVSSALLDHPRNAHFLDLARMREDVVFAPANSGVTPRAQELVPAFGPTKRERPQNVTRRGLAFAERVQLLAYADGLGIDASKSRNIAVDDLRLLVAEAIFGH